VDCKDIKVERSSFLEESKIKSYNILVNGNNKKLSLEQALLGEEEV